MQLAIHKIPFEEVWIFSDLDHEPSVPSYKNGQAVVLNDDQLGDPLHTVVFMYDSQPLKPLRIDWRPDGLGFMDGSEDGDRVNFSENIRSCKPNVSVRLKVYDVPLQAKQLIEHLKALEAHVYDPDHFNSKHFCDHLFGLEKGVEF